MIRRAAFIGALVVLSAPAEAAAQAAAPSAAQTAGGRLRVYLDCTNCFPDFLREEIRWVDFVREARAADVHVLVTTNETGGGGREYAIRFVGVGRLQGVDHSHRVVTEAGQTEDGRRRAVLGAVTVGLLDYLAHEGLPANLSIAARQSAGDTRSAPTADRWNFWVYSVRGSGSIEAQETTREMNWQGRLSADRVTDRWKIGLGADVNERTEHFDLEDDAPLTSRRQSWKVEGFAVKAFGPHWSAGGFAAVEASTFSNTALATAGGMAIEYSVFPYEQYASRLFRLDYTLGPRHVRYNEVTLFDKLSEAIAEHEFSATFDQRQPWGSLEANVEWKQYLHDLSKNRLQVNGDLSLRIARGLSVTIEGRASRIRDQISLPRRDARPEEVLLRLRQLRSGYQVDFSFGVTYTFGSIFNNIVNPRFGT